MVGATSTGIAASSRSATASTTSRSVPSGRCGPWARAAAPIGSTTGKSSPIRSAASIQVRSARRNPVRGLTALVTTPAYHVRLSVPYRPPSYPVSGLPQPAAEPMSAPPDPARVKAVPRRPPSSRPPRRDGDRPSPRSRRDGDAKTARGPQRNAPAADRGDRDRAEGKRPDSKRAENRRPENTRPENRRPGTRSPDGRQRDARRPAE